MMCQGEFMVLPGKLSYAERLERGTLKIGEQSGGGEMLMTIQCVLLLRPS